MRKNVNGEYDDRGVEDNSRMTRHSKGIFIPAAFILCRPTAWRSLAYNMRATQHNSDAPSFFLLTFRLYIAGPHSRS